MYPFECLRQAQADNSDSNCHPLKRSVFHYCFYYLFFDCHTEQACADKGSIEVY